MIANKWYCIAQTGTFDSGCTINVSFDSYVIQFSASVKYGSSAINITRCELPLSANLSLRLRESNGLWSVDLLSNNDITPEIVVADSPYWVAVNSVAGAGNIILTLKDISKDFNTGTGGSGGGLNENELRAFLDKYGYTQARDFWKYETTSGGAIHTNYHIIVDGGGAFGGAELGGGGESGGGGISEFYIQLGEGGQKYKLGNSGLPNVVQIPKYPVVPTNVSEFFNDAGYIGGEQAALIFSRISEVEARVEKLEKLWWVDENGNLHTTYNIVVEGGGAFGTGASVDAGGSGGLGRVVLVNDSGTEYASDENGIVRIPDYITKAWFDAQKFATQSWVLSKGYVSESVLVPIREDITTLKKDVADLKGMWTIKDGKLHTTYSIVVEGGGSFGEGSESGGGSAGGLGQITIRNQAGQEYKTDANGVVVIPTYLTSNALDGYATQQWVESKKYLTSIPTEYITETELTAKGYAVASEIAKTYATIESLNTTNTNLATVTAGLANVAKTVDALSKNFVNGIAKEAAKVSHALTFGSKVYDGSIAQTILPSDLDAVTLSGEQIITGAKTFSSLITANGGIKIPYTASLKIGDVTLIEEDGALKVLGNLVVTGGGAFGTGSTSGGGTSGGLGSVTIKTEGGIEYKSNSNGVVSVPNWITASALNGYATEAWVNNKGYLTGISSKMVTDALGYTPYNSANFTKATIKSTLGIADWALAASKPSYSFSEIGSKPTTAAGYGIADALTFTNNGTYVGANMPSSGLSNLAASAYIECWDGAGWWNWKAAKWITVGGTSSHFVKGDGTLDATTYLPLSGGTMTGAIVIGGYTSFGVSDGIFYLGNPSYPVYVRSNGIVNINGNAVIHAGNIGSQNVNSARKLYYIGTVPSSGFDANTALSGGGRMSNYASGGWWGSTMPAMSYGTIYQLQGDDADNDLAGQLAWDVNHANTTDTTRNLWWRATDGSNFANAKWHKIAFTDSNVASADYASNAGSADMLAKSHSGNINFSAGSALKLIRDWGEDGVSLGYPTKYQAGLSVMTDFVGWQMTVYAGAVPNPYFRSLQDTGVWKEWKQLAFLTDNVASATKLQTARTIWGQSFDGTGNVSGNIDPIASSTFSCGTSTNQWYSVYTMRLYAKSGSALYLGANDSIHMSISASGNVMIGTTTDNAYKLQVAGSAYIDGNINLNLHEITNAKAMHCYDSGTGYYIGGRNYGLGVTNGGALIYSYGATPISFYTSQTEMMRITGGGNVLIGTTTDSGYKLQVNGAGSFKPSSDRLILLEPATNSLDGSGIAFWSSGGWTKGTINASTLYLNSSSSGNVLIGTPTDSGYKLDVRGGNIATDYGIAGVSSSTYNRWSITHGSNRLYIQSGLTDGSGVNGEVWISGINTSSLGLLNIIATTTTLSGNLVVTGGGAFGSDVRYKDILNYTNIDLATIANAPLFTYRWNDREDKKVYLGTSAQYWLDTAFTNAVNTDNPNFFHLDYGALGVGLAIATARKVVDHEERIATLEKENKELKEKLNKYETLWHN